MFGASGKFTKALKSAFSLGLTLYFLVGRGSRCTRRRWRKWGRGCWGRPRRDWSFM